ncbi:cell division protein FtsQ/DivIB [Urechidicola croceus]|uniref:Cell division protein FtsQ/DivIB C-terminal domain-containing protein n=1 Tax=Urechidicola croceus TaxID=1850246 RepID=A0A1D8PAN0_9FLAO|nr:cell division protein FtsQ/DivIB [Urechidicola croceus]AOW21622.1 hypothetical protein LPB138_13440 [Urechidicola croceus]
MKVNWIYIKGVLLIGLVSFLFGFSNYKNSSQKVSDIDIQFEQGDNLFMSYEMVNKLLIQNGGSVKNQAKSLIDLNELENHVLAHPMVENATSFLTVDGRLKTRIKQRTPIGRINTSSESYYIDRQGEEMPLSENYSARVPLVTGILKEQNMDDLYSLLTYIHGDDFLTKQIVGVHVFDENQFKLMTRIGGHEIDLGKIDHLQTKFKNLKAFYNHTMVNKTIENYNKISLKYNNQVVCTKKNE